VVNVSDRPAWLGRTQLATLARVWKHGRVSRLEIAFNARLKSTIARWVPPGDVLEIGLAIKSLDKRTLREIIAHEAAHVVVWDLSGQAARPHGPEWAALMRMAGFEPRATLVRCGHRRSKPRGTRIRHFCAICHFSTFAKRRMPTWRCPECRAIGLEGTLTAERISS
jgi:predicted SprT family Zn-dependent metalloprotease